MQLILLYSGNPLPAMLELGFVAAGKGCDVRLILVDRGANDLALDRALVVYPVSRISSLYNGLDLRRILSFPITAWRIGAELLRCARPGCVVITSTLDVLLVARLVGWLRPIRVRHQVRDLHALQLGDGPVSRALRALERWLLEGCELLLYSAPAFYEQYYSSIFRGPAVLLENLPRPAVWRGYVRALGPARGFKVGYIGIIRYMSPLRNLVDAIETLVEKGVECSVLFAGGGDVGELRSRVRTPERFIFQGKFEYTTAVAGLHRDVDVIFAVYDRFDPNCRLAMPSKFYEALITRIPILVSKDTYVGELVERMGVGRAVDGESAAALAEALGEIGRPGCWHAQAKAALDAIDIGERYSAYDAALASAIAADVRRP